MARLVDSTQDLDVVASPEGAASQGVLSTHEVKTKSIQGAFSYFTRTLLLFGVGIATQGVLGAILEPEQFGLYGIVVTIGGLFTIISDVGLAASLIQKKQSPSTEELRTVFTVQQLLSWVVCGLVIATAYGMFHLGRMTIEGVYLAIAFGLSFPMVSLKTISNILLERQLAFEKLVIPAIAESLVFSGVTVFLALRGFGVMSYTYAVLARAIVGVIVTVLIKRWDIGISFSKQAFFELMQTGGKFQLNDMLAKAKDDIFYLTLAFIISPQQYGYITWAKTWSRQPYTMTVDNITALTFPAFSRLQHDKRLLARAIEKTIFFITLVAFPLFAGMAVMVYPFTLVVEKYAKWQPAIPTMVLFCVSLAFATFSTPLVNTLNATGKISKTLRMMVFWTIAQWVLFPLLYPLVGFHAVALIGALLGATALIVVRMVQEQIPFSFGPQLWRQTLATLVMGGVLYGTSATWGQSLSWLLVGVVVGGVIYGSLMLLTGFEKIKQEVYSLIQKGT